MRLLKHEVDETKLKAIFASSPDAITTSDPNGNITDCNQATLDLHGYSSKEELIGKSAFELIAKKDHKRAMENLKKTLEQGSVRNIEYTFLAKDGREFPAELSASVVKDSSGNPTGFVAVTKDITERKRAEEALRDSEKKWSNSFNSLEDVMIIINKDYTIEKINNKRLKLLGKTREEVIGKKCYQVVCGMDAPSEFCPCKRTLKTGKVESVDRYMELFGKYFSIKSSPIFNERGEIVGFVDLMRDTTERKKAEERIRESEEKYRNLFENARDVIVTFDLKGNMTNVNKAAAKYGFKKDEMLGKSMLKFVSEKYWPRLLKELAEIARGKLMEGEIEIITPEGKKIAGYRSNPIRQGNRVVGFQTTLRDITERKAMERKLQEYAEHLEEKVEERTRQLQKITNEQTVLLSTVPAMIFWIDKEGNFIRVNEAFAAALHKSPDDIKGKSLFDFYPQHMARRYHNDNLNVMESGTPKRHIEEPVKTPVGIIWVSTDKIPYRDANGNILGIIGFSEDITERKRMEQQLLKSERLAAIGEVATMVGHDLRNPLQSIENATYYLNNELPRLPPSTPIPQKAIEMLQVINNSVDYADKIIKDLYDFSATKKPILNKTNINTIVKETLSQVKAPKNMKLITKLGHLPEIKADKDMIKRAFLNLAINGIQAMEKGGTLKVSTKKTRGLIEVSFKDTGTGIPKEDMKKIFTPFFTTKARGIGMGLPICKKFVDAHGGTIEVESEKGKETTFTVKLPTK